jgi:hypothetical protein
VLQGHVDLIISSKPIKKFLEFSGKYLNSPEQRLILGVTALMTQPFIDLYSNRKSDEETKRISVARTVAKIIAGTLVGVAVRQISISAINKFSHYDPKHVINGIVTKLVPKTKNDIFLPLFKKTGFKPCAQSVLNEQLKLYRKAMGTTIATVVMIVTNFAIDAPLTKWLTGVFNKKLKKEGKK